MIWSLLASPDDMPKVAAAIDEQFRNAPQPTKSESERAFQLGFVSMLGNVKMILLSICAAVTFAILLVAVNTMAMSVRERVKEVGVLKTLGFTTAKVLSLIVAEAVILSLIGGLIGCLLAAGAVTWVGRTPMFFVQGMTMPPAALAISMGIALLIGLISSLFPAWSAARLPITEALRHTG